LDSSRVRLRSRVAAAFFAASCLSALVCAIPAFQSGVRERSCTHRRERSPVAIIEV
jgi:hypothetical protein